MKKFIAGLSAAVMLLGAAAGLAACGGSTQCEHNYEENTAKRVAATCHSDGTKYLVCSKCNDEKTEAITVRPAHTFTGDWVEVDGEKHAKKCSVTGCTAVDTATETHNFEEDATKRVPATCIADGEKTLVCSDCGAEKKEAITERAAHTFTGEWVKVDGENHAKKCSVAGCTAVDSENNQPHNFENQPLVSGGADGHHQECVDCGAASDNTAHVWGEETQVTTESFYHEGVNEKECECGAKFEIKIPALNSMGISVNDTNWKFGTGEITNWDTCAYTFEEMTQKNGDGSGYTDGATEIKPDWFSNETFDTFVIITYTFEDDVHASVVATFTGVGATEGPLSEYSLRIGVKDGNALKDVKFYSGTNFTTETNNYVKEFKKGDTLVLIFKHEKDGWDQGHYSVTLSKANPTDNAE